MHTQRKSDNSLRARSRWQLKRGTLGAIHIFPDRVPVRSPVAMAGIVLMLACASSGQAPSPTAGRVATTCPAWQADSLLAYYHDLGDSGTTHPRMLHPGAQVYPAEMEATGTPGWARIAFLIRPDGTADPCALRVLEVSDDAFKTPGVTMILNSRFSRPSRPTYAEQILRWQVIYHE